MQTLSVFVIVSGRKATVPSKDKIAYGPFLELMTDVFKALGITASPESRARWAIRADRDRKDRDR